MKLLLQIAAGLLLLAAIIIGGVTAQDSATDELQKTAQALFAPLPDMVDNPNNPVTDEKVELGKMLFYDPRLSLSGFVSCNSCHNLATFGSDNLSTSVGHRWALGPRNAPTVLNAALHTSQFWDGRAPDVEAQAQGPVLNPIEMATPDQDFAVERIASIPEYVEKFAVAFPEQEEPLTYANIANAIAAFERTLMTPGRFDEYLNGDATALSDTEKAGLNSFIQNGCAGCHSGPALGGNMFARFGVVEAYWEATRDFVAINTPTMPMDVGKFAVTHDEADLYVFKVPSLRNIARTYPYFHDGSIWNLRDATNVMAKVQLGKELSEEELDNIVAFMHALDGTIPEYALQLPVLPASTDTTSRPSNQ